MKITREVNGETMEFELTPAEIIQFINELDMSDAMDAIEYLKDELIDDYGINIDTITDEQLSDIADAVAQARVDDDHAWELRNDAVRDYFAENHEEFAKSVEELTSIDYMEDINYNAAYKNDDGEYIASLDLRVALSDEQEKALLQRAVFNSDKTVEEEQKGEILQDALIDGFGYVEAYAEFIMAGNSAPYARATLEYIAVMDSDARYYGVVDLTEKECELLLKAADDYCRMEEDSSIEDLLYAQIEEQIEDDRINDPIERRAKMEENYNKHCEGIEHEHEKTRDDTDLASIMQKAFCALEKAPTNADTLSFAKDLAYNIGIEEAKKERPSAVPAHNKDLMAIISLNKFATDEHKEIMQEFINAYYARTKLEGVAILPGMYTDEQAKNIAEAAKPKDLTRYLDETGERLSSEMSMSDKAARKKSDKER